MLVVLSQQISSSRRIKVHCDSALRAKGIPQSSTDRVVSDRVVYECAKSGVGSNGVDDVLVKDLCRDFRSSLTAHFGCYQQGD